MGVFDNLDKDTNKLINMYTTARQFKNAITSKEKLVIQPNGVVINKLYPYMVNKAFSCEVYLKFIIKISGDKIKKEHSLLDLYNLSNIKEEFEKEVLENTKKLGIKYSLEDMYMQFNSISNAFVEWRYFYEHEDILSYYGFLEVFSDYLDRYCKRIIKSKWNIDMNEYTNI